MTAPVPPAHHARWLPDDRIGLLDALANWVLALVLARALVPWTVVPPLGWALLVATAAWQLIEGVVRARELPLVRPGARPGIRIAGAVAALVVTSAVVVGSLSA